MISYVQSLKDFNNFTPIQFSDTNLFFLVWILNNKTGEIVGFNDVKDKFRIYSYTYTVDYLKQSYGTRSNEVDARNCNQSDWQGSDLIKK